MNYPSTMILFANAARATQQVSIRVGEILTVVLLVAAGLWLIKKLLGK